MAVTSRLGPSAAVWKYSEENRPLNRRHLPQKCTLGRVCPHWLLAVAAGPCKEKSFRLHPGKVEDRKRFALLTNGSAEQSHDCLEMHQHLPTSAELQSNSAIVEKSCAK